MLLTIAAQIVWRGFSTANSVLFVRNTCWPSFTLSTISFLTNLIVSAPLGAAGNYIKTDLDVTKKSTMLSSQGWTISRSTRLWRQSCLGYTPTSASATSLRTVRASHYGRCSTKGCHLCRATCGFLGADGEQTVDAWRTSMEGAWVHFNLSRRPCQARQRPCCISRASAESLTIRGLFFDPAVDARTL